jgi:hypothetical protein
LNPSKNIGLSSLPITQTIGNFCLWSGNGRSKTYEMIAAGELETIRVGKRQLVLTESYLQLIAERRATGPGIAPEIKPVPKRRPPPKIARASDPTAAD